MGTTTQTSSSSSQPGFAPQVAGLTTAFNAANGALTQAQGANAPTNFTAQFTPDQLATFKQMMGFGSNGAIPTSEGTAANTNTAAGTNAATGALTSLGTFDPSATNNPNTLVSAANQYVAGQNIPAQVQAAMLPAEQQANQTTLPGITQNADIGGNADSSRTGIAQGMVEQGLGEQSAALNGSLTGIAFGNGLNLAENQAQNNNANTIGALSDLINGGNMTTGTGLNLGTGSIGNQGSLFNIAGTGGAGEQAANQAQLTNEEQQYQAQTNDPFAALNNYMGIVGSNNWGQNTTGTQSTSPSALSMIGGLLGAGGSLMGGFGKLGSAAADAGGWGPLFGMGAMAA
jgi:hypothetical protein